MTTRAIEKPAIIGLDIGKDVLQVHAIGRKGNVIANRKLQRSEVLKWFSKYRKCVVGMEAVGTSNYWARALLKMGHDVRIMSARYVKPFRKVQKSDRIDAEAITTAVQHPSMRFVQIRTEDQQAELMLHRVRETLRNQKTNLVNTIRGHLAEFGYLAKSGQAGAESLLKLVENSKSAKLPALARRAIEALARQIRAADVEIIAIEKDIRRCQNANTRCRLLRTIPGIGFLGASALAASIPDPNIFRRARDVSAWLGLVPRQFSTGGKTILGRITKNGSSYLRYLLFLGARNVLQEKRSRAHPLPRAIAVMVRNKRPFRVICIAYANRIARIVLAVLKTGKPYRYSASVSAAALA